MSVWKNKVVWVTGASSGIGAEIAKQAADAGARVILSARNEAKLQEVKQSIKNTDDHLVLPLDLSQSENFSELVDQVMSKYGQIDVLVNCWLGSELPSLLSPTAVDQFSRSMAEEATSFFTFGFFFRNSRIPRLDSSATGAIWTSSWSH